MGCYDSSILRPLLPSQRQNNTNINSNEHNSGIPFTFWRRNRRRLPDEIVLEDAEEDIVYKGGKKQQQRRHLGLFPAPESMALRKVGLLIWKNLMIRKRHYIVTAFEIILPTLFSLILVYGRAKASSSSHGLDNFIHQFVGNETLPPEIFEEKKESEYSIHCGMSVGNCVVAYAPNNTDVEDIVTLLKLKQDSATKIEWRGFQSESDVEKYVLNLSFNSATGTGSSETLRAALIFEDGLRTERGVINYKIRMMDTYYLTHDVMSSRFPAFQFPGTDHNNIYRYDLSGFTQFQINLDRALIQKFGGQGQSPTRTLVLQPFPYPPYEKTQVTFSDLYFIILPNVLVIGFIFIVPSIIRGVVNERETGIKELMKLFGIPNWMHWFAWTINSMLILSISVTIVIFLFFSSFLNQEAGALLTKSDPFVWWTTLFLYVLSSTAFCFFISSFFQKPTIAITVGIILWLTTYYATSVPFSDNDRYLKLSYSTKMFVALLPNTALYWAIKVMCGFEGKGSGAQWSNLFHPLSSTDNLSLGHVLFMFVFDTILYFLLTLYMEAVLPTQYGVRKPWYFIFQPSFWKFSNTGRLRVDDKDDEPPVMAGFEKEPEGLRAGVEIRDLQKRYSRGKVAVGGVSVKMFDGQIFALLGHNGAGKSTTISCCIGMTAPSAGTVVINGYDIRTDLDSVRNHIGLCPQHNLLFDELTVDEHLIFFGKLKGLNANDAKNERVEMLTKLQLSEKTNTLSSALSGGQKRKLSLGIALIGRAKVVFLDEPTSGMDVEARRAIWDLLLQLRESRTIVLTTHQMEEADVLGDRIGIMAHGKLRCCGTSLFLKKYYGAGYTLSMIMADNDQGNKNQVLSLVQRHISSANFKPESDTASGMNPCEVFIVIPTESCSTSAFPSMFKDLQEFKHKLGIKAIGMSLTTMDEVFIKADEDLPDNSEEILVQDLPSSSETSVLNSQGNYKNGAVESNEESGKCVAKARLQGCSLMMEQFAGLFIKRFRYSARKWRLVLSQVAIPVFILVVAILSGNVTLEPPSSPEPLKINLGVYKFPVTLYTSNDEKIGAKFAQLAGASAKKYDRNGTKDIIQGLIEAGEQDLAVYRERHIVAAEFTPQFAKALYSTIPFHSEPLAINLVSNTLLGSMQENLRIEVTNHPLSGGYDYLLEALQVDPGFSVATALMFGALAPIGLALLAASYIVSPLEERLCKGKQLQLMTGVHPILYWWSSFAWDFLVMLAVVIVMVLCFPIFQIASSYTSYGGAGVIFLILITYGFSAIPFSYICSLLVGTVPGGFSFVTIIHIATGMVLPFVVYILESIPGLTSITDQVRFVGRFFPTFGASVSTMRFVETALKNSRCSFLPDNAETLLCDAKVSLEPKFRQCCANCHDFPDAECMKPTPYITWSYERPRLISAEDTSPTAAPGIGQELLYLFFLGICYQILLILLELGIIQRILGLIFRTKTDAFQNNSDDEDVEKEADRVHQLVRAGRVAEDALVVESLCKNYGSLAAVANLNFAVHHGECFGLLGVNGAGKTTSFRMLTGDEIRSNGNAYAAGKNLDSSKKQFLANIGYCPQFDGIVGVLTGGEMVELFGRLRGVKNVAKQCNKWLSRVGLLDARNVQCRKYSGGMKRRLSAAMAMIGDPEIVLLDEPTSGVDPVSRREFWKIISSIRESGRAIVLTSHSMDEITACCSRLGIMVNGQLQCLGGVQHLKNKFAEGYTLSLKLKQNMSETNDLGQLETEIMSRFSPCSLKDKHQTAMQFHIKNAALPWDMLFSTMEDLKFRYDYLFEDYAITETTLEEVFLAFARKQYSSREAKVSLFKKIITCQCFQ